jgi:GcrA cell cycle regulator
MSNQYPDSWTASRIEQLKTYAASGLPMRDIARKLGITRNAVLGKLRRLGLPLGRQPNPDGTPHKRRPVPRVAKIQLFDGWRKPRQSRREAPGPSLVPGLCDLPLEPAAAPVTIGGLLPHHCRWPLGEPGVDMLYCGAAKLEPYSYCDRHCAVAFKPRGG